MIAFLSGYQFVDLGPDGGPYDEMTRPKVVVHTTEGSTIAGAEAAFKSYPPHLGYDPIRRIKRQYVRLDRHSYALRGAESDDEFCVQVEIVGFADQTHIWSEDMYRNIGEDVVAPLTEAIGVPRIHLRFYRAGEDGIVLATKSSPIRLRPTQFRNFSGWLGHQHVPGRADNGTILEDGDSHWDPGGFLMDKAFSYAGGGEMASFFDLGNNAEVAARRLEALVAGWDRTLGPVPEDVWINKAAKQILTNQAAQAAAIGALAEAVRVGEANDLTADKLREIVDEAASAALKDQVVDVDVNISGRPVGGEV